MQFPFDQAMPPKMPPRYRILYEAPGLREDTVDYPSLKLASQAWGEAAWRFPPGTVRLVDRRADREMARN
jgi:hypothetical protein